MKLNEVEAIMTLFTSMMSELKTKSSEFKAPDPIFRKDTPFQINKINVDEEGYLSVTWGRRVGCDHETETTYPRLEDYFED